MQTTEQRIGALGKRMGKLSLGKQLSGEVVALNAKLADLNR